MSHDALISACVSDCDTSYRNATGRSMSDVGLDPFGIVTAILAIVAQMCPQQARDLRAAAQTRGAATVLAVQAATRQALREQHPGVLLPWARFNGAAIANAVIATVATRDEVQIQAGLECCGR